MNVLLANPAPVSSFRREDPSSCEDHTNGDTPSTQLGNYVSATLGNYVSENRLNLGKSVSADTYAADTDNLIGIGIRSRKAVRECFEHYYNHLWSTATDLDECLAGSETLPESPHP